MAATLFQNILKNAERKGLTDTKSREAVSWYRKTLRKTTSGRGVTPARLIRDQKENTVNAWSQTAIGKMYFAYYDPKHKESLPYYDTFPIIIPIRRYKDGFLSINLHYLPPILRAKLLDALYDTVNDDKLDENTKMMISYKILNSATKFSEFKPCVKRYLGSHFRSKFIRVDPKDWTSAVFLPVENFKKKSQKQVWAESRRSLR